MHALKGVKLRNVSLVPKRRTTRRIFVLIVVAAAAWRLWLAAAMPAVSRDGALYCWQARDLGRVGTALLQAAEYEQHPLYAATMLATQRVASALGASESPLLWQRCGQAVSLVAGIAVVLLSAAVARRVGAMAPVRESPLPDTPVISNAATSSDSHAHRVETIALFAAAIAALLPLNALLSASVMSDELHVALYLAGALCMVDLRSFRRAAACGVLAGVAFLTRPEGAVVLLGGLAALAVQRSLSPSRRGVLCAAVLASFLACAAPYWAMSGKLSTKLGKHPLEMFQPRVAPGPAKSVGRAALVRDDLAWYALVPRALYETTRAGRVVVVFFALPALWVLRRRLRSPALIGITTCALAHFSLTVWLIHRAGYLDPRHTLVVVLLLVPFAAMTLGWLLQRSRNAGFAAVAICLLPLAVYALRVPNGGDRYVRDAAAWLTQRDPHIRERLLLGGSDERRIAFYADTRFQPWPENAQPLDERWRGLREHVVHHRPDYVVISTGSGRELMGNAELVERLARDEAFTDATEALTRISIPGRDFTVHMFALRWSAAVIRP